MDIVLNRKHTLSMMTAMFLGAGILSKAEAATFFVKGPSPTCAIQTTNPGGNGSSWSNAFNNLDSALKAATLAGGTNVIQVSKGTYKPCTPYGGGYTGTEPNLVTFNIPSNTTIIGGFDLGPTILSGDINGDDIDTPTTLTTNKTDNAWHVLTADNVTGVVLQNLTIRDGYAAGPDQGTVGPSPELLLTIDYLHMELPL